MNTFPTQRMVVLLVTLHRHKTTACNCCKAKGFQDSLESSDQRFRGSTFPKQMFCFPSRAHALRATAAGRRPHREMLRKTSSWPGILILRAEVSTKMLGEDKPLGVKHAPPILIQWKPVEQGRFGCFEVCERKGRLSFVLE